MSGVTCQVSNVGIVVAKVGQLQSIYLYLSRLGCSLRELQFVWPDKLCQSKHLEDKILHLYIDRIWNYSRQKFHMYLLDLKSIPSLNSHNKNKRLLSIRLSLLTKTTWKLKTPGGILSFPVLVQVWLVEGLLSTGPTPSILHPIDSFSLKKQTN